MRNIKRNNQRQSKPLISVIMPVYNAERYVVEAVASIQTQTVGDWELIVVDDASSDRSLELVKMLAGKDKRIVVLENKQRLGVAETTMKGLKVATGDFIARMDADDVSMPNRFEVQMKFLRENPEVIAVGGQCEVIDESGDVVGEKRFPVNPKKVYEMMFRSIALQQPSVMIDRRMLPNNFVWYERKMETAEEVELIFRLFKYGVVTNVGETVLKYRIHGKNTSLADPKKTFYITFLTRLRSIVKHGYKPSLGGLVVTLGQLLLVSVMPAKMIYPVYAKIRGIKEVSRNLVKNQPVLAWLRI